MKRKYNLTTHMALPLLGWKREIYKPYLVNSYIRHEEVDRFNDKKHLFILLEWSSDETFKKLESALGSSKFCESHYDVDKDGSMIMFVMKIPKRMQEDFEKYLDGKYSKMSDQAKKIIMGSSQAGGTIYKILYKEESFKKALENKIDTVLSDDAEVYSSIKDQNLLHKQVFNNEKLETLT